MSLVRGNPKLSLLLRRLCQGSNRALSAHVNFSADAARPQPIDDNVHLREICQPHTNRVGTALLLFERFGIDELRAKDSSVGTHERDIWDKSDIRKFRETRNKVNSSSSVSGRSLLEKMPGTPVFDSILIPAPDEESITKVRPRWHTSEFQNTLTQVGPTLSQLWTYSNIHRGLKREQIFCKETPYVIFSSPCNYGRCELARFSTGSNAEVSKEPEEEVARTKKENATVSVGVSWIEKVVPKHLRPYAYLARLDKPIGTWLLAWPCFWSIAIAAEAGGYPDLKMLSLFGVGAILLRGAGCTVNDLLDRDIDGKVERTRLRPIVSGALTPFQGLTFLGVQLLLGLGILLQLNTFRHVSSHEAMDILVRGSLDASVALPLYLSGVGWTLVYDTIYAHQDKMDDTKVGVKSTALRFGEDTRLWLTGFSTASISGMSLAGYNAALGWPFYVGVAATAGHLAWQISTVDTQSRADCNDKFVSNKWLGALVFSGICLGKLVV
uniref:4-hydroxybenzoate polyprenyltransferase, mitochondrial n=1 Tax=Physcomitrium patens TaxID=3218 RepID=A0A7I4F7H4_PHYPA